MSWISPTLARACLCVLAAGCGRFSFETQGAGDARAADADPDGPLLPGDVTTGLVEYWRFEVQSTGPARFLSDVVGGHDLTCLLDSCPPVVAGHSGMAIACDTHFLDSEIGIMPPQYSVAAWMRRRTDADGNRHSVVAKRVGNDTSDSWQLGFSETNEPFYFSTQTPGDNTYIESTIPIATNEWVHVAATFDGTTHRTYINGTLHIFANRAAPAYDSGPLVVCYDVDNGSTVAKLVGDVDELRIYDRALAHEDVLSLTVL